MGENFPLLTEKKAEIGMIKKINPIKRAFPIPYFKEQKKL
jgi:hypothetical protein